MTAEVPNVLLSIEPEHAEAILDDEKWWEYRRVAPAREPPYRVVLYATAPVQAAIGEAWVETVLGRPIAALVDATVSFTPHEIDEVLDYFEGRDTGYALRMDHVERFDEPLSLKQIRGAGYDPAQNFRYMKPVSVEYAEQAGVTV